VRLINNPPLSKGKGVKGIGYLREASPLFEGAKPLQKDKKGESGITPTPFSL